MASIGVGVGTGKIMLDRALLPGKTYVLPPIVVVNTGDEVSDYGVSVEYNETQDQRKPDRSWFRFVPLSFTLAPGKTQPVSITITVPIRSVPGDYFAYLEAHPIAQAHHGQSRVGIAAASKLFFTVASANSLLGIYYRLASLWQIATPYNWIVVVLGVTLVSGYIVKRLFVFQIGIRIKKNPSDRDDALP